MKRHVGATRHRTCVAVALLISLFALVGCARREAVVLQDKWDLVSLGGSRVGYVHTVTRRLYEPEEAIVTYMVTEMRMKRLLFPLTIRESVEFRESLDGVLLSTRTGTYASKGETVVRTVVEGNDRARVTTETAGTTHTTEIAWDPEALGPYAQTKLVREQALQPGGTIEFKAFLPELQRFVVSRLSVEGRETITIEGQSFETWKGTMDQDVLPGIQIQVWLDDDGEPVRSVMEFIATLTTVRGTREQALADIAPEDVADFMTRFFIKSNRIIANPQDMNEALFRIEAAEKDIAALTLEDRRQRVEERSKGSVLLRVRALGDAEKPSGEVPGPEFLESSPYIQSSDSEIVRLAQEAVGRASEPEEKARLLTRWVHDNIRKKNLSIGFASAKEVALSSEGDCTEHSVLLAALLRAEGIPSRVVVGLVYWNGVFGYHMWTEAFLNDWTALDATFGQELVDATHIKLDDTALDTSSPASSFLSIVGVVGRMTLSVEEMVE